MNNINSINASSISCTYVQNADATQSTAASAKPQRGQHRAEQGQKGDSISLSDSAKSLSAARQAVQDTPDVRTDKVADIKQRVQDGTYTVPSKVLARKMLDHQTQQ